MVGMGKGMRRDGIRRSSEGIRRRRRRKGKGKGEESHGMN